MTDAEAQEYETWWRLWHPRHPSDTTSLALERSLRDVAKRLGIRVQVMHDHASDGFFFDCGLASTPRAGVLIDQEAILSVPPRNSGQLADLLYSELIRARDQVFANARKRMTELDGRLVELTHGELSLLHELIYDLENFAYADGHLGRSVARHERVQKYRALLDRFFR